MDLHTYIKKRIDNKILFTNEEIYRIIVLLFVTVLKLHIAKIAHRDIKP